MFISREYIDMHGFHRDSNSAFFVCLLVSLALCLIFMMITNHEQLLIFQIIEV